MRVTIEWQGLHADTVGPGLPFARQALELPRLCSGEIVEFRAVGVHVVGKNDH